MNRDKSSFLGAPAPYGHACASCAQSKCKCIIRPAGGPCERCYRLKKECRPAQSVRRRNPRKSAVTKTARLEEKLDGLVSLVKAGVLAGAVTSSPQTTASAHNSAPSSTVHTNSNHNGPALTPATSDSTCSSYEPSPVEAEEYLTDFREYKLKYFPFVCIPPTISAQQLRQERPFLWLCIMAVGSKSTSQQQALGTKVRQTVAQEMIVQSAKSIDLLLGFLAFIGWGHYQTSSKPFLSVFAQLAMALVFELGLTKPVPKDTQVPPCVNPKYSKPTTPRTMEERRAVLGCFLVTSIISSYLQKIDALRWTSHMDECLRILDERKECLDDGILVQQVRLQLIAEKVAIGTSQDEVFEATEHSDPTSRYHKSLHSQLQAIKAHLLAEFQNNEVVLLHLYSTELETAFSSTFLNANQLTFQEHKSVDAGLESIQSWFNVFFTIPPAAYVGFTFSICSQLVRCLSTLFQLKALDGSVRDENSIWDTVDPLFILNRVITNLEQVAILAGLDNTDSPEGDIFSRVAQLFRSLRPVWEAQLQPDDLPLSTAPATQNIDEFALSGSLGVDSFDDWLADFFGPSNQ